MIDPGTYVDYERAGAPRQQIDFDEEFAQSGFDELVAPKESRSWFLSIISGIMRIVVSAIFFIAFINVLLCF